jgi:glycosyltransferase involved in cell wall biosynthesis
MQRVVWWGRFDPEYSRNRIVRSCFRDLGYEITDFHPRCSSLADLEARCRRLLAPDLVWVPCFRQRDLAQALRWGRRQRVPVIFDPLISAYDKQVFEREKFTPDSPHGRKLLSWEAGLLGGADLVIADTAEHARFFADTFGLDSRRCAVIPVGAEETLFRPAPQESSAPGEVPEVLFYGSFIPLQGPQVIARAARIYTGPPVRWHFIGSGPLLAECQAVAEGVPHVTFTDWVDYGKLPDHIRRAAVVLGIFGTTPKAGRVIPNKVYQSLACGKPLITMASPAYPADVSATTEGGIRWVSAGDPQELATAVADLLSRPASLPSLGEAAFDTYRRHFSTSRVRSSLGEALSLVGLPVGKGCSAAHTTGEVCS